MNQGEHQILREIHQVIQKAISEEYRSYHLRLHKEIGRPNGVVKSIEALSLFNLYREWLTNDLESVAAPYTSASWLFALRGCPNDYFQNPGQTSMAVLIEARTLAEIITDHIYENSKSVLISHQELLGIALDANFWSSLGRLLGGVRLLTRINGIIRHTTTSEEFLFNKSDDILPSIRTSDARESVRAFDRSLDMHGIPFSRSALVIKFSESSIDLQNGNKVPLLLRVNKSLTLPSEIQKYNYGFADFDLEPIAKANRDALTKGIFEKDNCLPSAIYLALAICHIPDFQPEGLKHLLERGLSIVPIKALELALQTMANLAVMKSKAIFPSLNPVRSPQEIIKQMSRIKDEISPLKIGSIIRLDNSLCIIDAVNLYQLFEEALVYPKESGKVGQLKGPPFEEYIREIIAQTCWKPSVQLKQQEGVTLKNEKTNEDLTDIDAIGEFEDKLLIVSCKNLQYSDEYYKGDYKKIRNQSSDLENYIKDWQKIKSYFQEHLKPMNKQYDFSQYKTIIAIVCTPTRFIVKSGIGETLEFADLPCYVSKGELSGWLIKWCDDHK